MPVFTAFIPISSQDFKTNIMLNLFKNKEHALENLIEINNQQELFEALKRHSPNELFINLNGFEISSDLTFHLKKDFLTRFEVLPLFVKNNYLFCATSTPKSETEQLIRLKTAHKPLLIKAQPEQIKSIIESYFGNQNPKSSLNAEVIAKLSKNRTDESEDAIAKVDELLDRAVILKASDIHIFPVEKLFQISLRIDGLLHKLQALGKTEARTVIARIKILANLNITEKQLPQDGNITIMRNGAKVDFRVSLIPTVDGDSITIRVLDSIENIKKLSQVGFEKSGVKRLKSLLSDSGIILVTGQTGSGKSTTIYALISELINKNLNIITVEDPVEYKLPGIRQIQVHEDIGYSFSNALRSILRHDPHVIVIGEIRDKVTAQIAIQSALTGHLVISTLHTKSAIGSITRLLEFGIDAYLVSSVLKAVVSQKLVRKLCPKCKGREQGCVYCNHTRYSSRCPIYELLAVSKPLVKLIAKASDEQELLHQAQKEGFELMEEYAQRLVEQKITDNQEIIRKLNSYE